MKSVAVSRFLPITGGSPACWAVRIRRLSASGAEQPPVTILSRRHGLALRTIARLAGKSSMRRPAPDGRRVVALRFSNGWNRFTQGAL